MNKYMIYLPKDYKPYKRKKLDWCKYSFGICIELEIFFQKWQEAKNKRIAHKIAKSAGLNPGTLRYSMHLARVGKLRLCDRKYFEKFCNEFERRIK